MPTYQVKPLSTISHEDVLYQAGEVVELPSELGAFHEPNLIAAITTVSDEDEDDEDEDDSDDDSEDEITGKAFTLIAA